MSTSKCASRHKGMHCIHIFLNSQNWSGVNVLRAGDVASWLRTRRFIEHVFNHHSASNHWKKNRAFPSFLFTRLHFLSSSVFLFCILTDPSIFACYLSKPLEIWWLFFFYYFFCQKLDDGWPENVEEQGLLLLIWRHHITKEYNKDVF